MAKQTDMTTPERPADTFNPPRTLDEARAQARNRFKDRLQRGEQIGGCDCHEEGGPDSPDAGQDARVAGVRFLDSGRTHYFDPQEIAVEVGDWVVVETNRGREAGRVVIAPHQVRVNLLEGELKPVLRRLGDADVETMNRLKKDAATAIKTFGVKIREHGLGMKPISAEYNFDGSHLTLNFSSSERVDFRDLARDLAATFRCRIELKQVGPRDEARLLGGLGRCGRTLCCASWLPVYPDISMSMAKAQDLPLNPSKVSGVCGRLLCCLSYENDQYKQMKALMPRLGQRVETPKGAGTVMALQILKELVTVRIEGDNSPHVFASADLGFTRPDPAPARADSAKNASPPPVDMTGPDGQERSGSRRRRRRGRSSKTQSDTPVV